MPSHYANFFWRSTAQVTVDDTLHEGPHPAEAIALVKQAIERRAG